MSGKILAPMIVALCLVVGQLALQFENYRIEMVYIFEGGTSLKAQVKIHPVAYSWDVFTGIFREREPELRAMAAQLLKCNYGSTPSVHEGRLDSRDRCAVFDATLPLPPYTVTCTLSFSSAEGCVEELYTITKTIFTIEKECYLIIDATPRPETVSYTHLTLPTTERV